MRRLVAFALVLLPLLALVAPRATAAAPDAAAEAAPQGYIRFPTASADRIAFTADGDIWWVPREGGLATRLTSAPGTESWPRWSPDGQLLAYAGVQDGNAEVYVIGRDGGVPRRLTIDPSADVPVGWTADGRVLFRSRRAGANYAWHVYAVPATGGPAELLKVGPAAVLSMASDGETVAFNRLYVETRTWKRYLGGTAQDVWLGNTRTQGFRKLTQYPGNDINPGFWGDRVVFLSDRDGTMNLWSTRRDGGDLRQHTRHADFDARFLDVQGGAAVYTLGADLMACDLASGSSRRVPVTLPTDLAQAAAKTAPPSEHLGGFAFSPDGHRLAVNARGEIASVPLKEGRTIDLTRSNSAAHEREPAWSPDGKSIAYISDEGGEDALWIVPADGSTPGKRLTRPGSSRLFPPHWSPDGKWLAYSTSDQDLVIADAKTGSTRSIAKSAAWEIRSMAWSPDSRWLAFANPTPAQTEILTIWDSKNGSLHPVTSEWVNSTSPSWDPKGRFLYFLSDRIFDPKIGNVDFSTILDSMTRPHALVLRQGELDPFFPRDEKSKDEDEKGSGDEAKGAAKDDVKADKGKGGKDSKPAPKPVAIDFEGLADRIVAFPVPPSNYGGLLAAKDSVLFLEVENMGLLGSDDDDSEGPGGKLHAFDLEKKKDAVIVENVAAYEVSPDGSRLAWRGKKGLSWQEGFAPARGGGGGGGGDDESGPKEVDLSSWRLAIDRRAEWRQIFDECWRLQREFFWDASMNHVDWKGVRDRYAALLPRVTTREELNDLMGLLIAELCMGHTYIWSGGDTGGAPKTGESVGLLGATLAPDTACNCQRFEKVLAGENWAENGRSPLTLPQAGVKAGDRLFAIDGRTVTAADDPAAFLLGKAGKLVALEVGKSADRKASRKIEVEAIGDDSRLRYLEWVSGNRARVEALSKGRIGYVHIPDMGGLGLSEFSRQFYQQLDKDALIIDDRYNGGGFVSQLIIERLRRVLIAWDRPRRGQPTTYPYRVFLGPTCMLVNESAGSDGDIFPESYQKLGLGPLIGMRTWGGVVGIRSDKAFVDGGMSTQPEFAWWEPRRGWGLENEGVHPDIVIDNDPASVVAGRDPQLEKGVEYLLGKLATWQRPAPEFGPAPDKSKDAFATRNRDWLGKP